MTQVLVLGMRGIPMDFFNYSIHGIPNKLHSHEHHKTCRKLPILLGSCDKSVKIRIAATCHLQTGYNLLKQLAASLWIPSFDNQLATSLLTACNRLQ